MIYLDNAATTKISPEVLEAMMPYLTEAYGNAGSLHNLGRQAAKAIDNARQQVADFLNCKPENIIFTSGGSDGTEAWNRCNVNPDAPTPIPISTRKKN